MEATKSTSNTSTDQQFKSYYDWMTREGDSSNANKLLEIYEKKIENMFYLCFAGHFSAGKSSLINYMIGQEVLPKSPIPTSANIVKLSKGQGAVKVYFKNKAPILYQAPYDINIIKDYATNKGSIKELQMYLSNRNLPANTTLMDTPGIDAADDADRFMTESVLHLIDELFYVMDYNHVQSEVNLYFLKQMNQLNIPVHLIINQIDKHNEAELSFKKYKRNIEQTFEQWHIKPDTIHFTSSKDFEHPLNEIQTLKSFIYEKMNNHVSLNKQIEHAFQAVLNEHKQYLKSKYEISLNDDIEVTEEDLIAAEATQTRLNTLENIQTLLGNEFREEMQMTLKNAYLMPASSRDAIESFLISRQADFKVGFIGSKKKTKDEMISRRLRLLNILQETANTTIEWKLKEKLHGLLQDYHLVNEATANTIQAFHIELPSERLDQQLHSGAKVNGQYVLNYSNDLSQAIKQHYRQTFNTLLNKLFTMLESKIQDEIQERLAEFNQMSKQREIMTQIRQNDDNLKEKLKEFNTVKHKNSDLNLLKLINERNHADIEAHPKSLTQEVVKTVDENALEELDSKTQYARPETVTASIDLMLEQLYNEKAMQRLVKDLDRKNKSIKNRQLTVALFGTFSAGKSSFSNALFGEKILPVSPNPTTAVISRIKPVTSQYTHGTVIISIKSETDLIRDLKTITKYISKNETRTYDEWIEWLSKNKVFQSNELSKMYQSYLEALLKGNEGQKENLGQNIAISLDEFEDYVTDETKACFIKQVDLYYDSPMTQKGITIVDTPGADSVNARHTNVAFDYIKEADAILYVTYFNHAITSGDRDFLMQLGRVKESFEMDKMFFIVNAADLAENDQELDLVVDYVKDQLLQFGIRNAKIFPVSSKDTLEEKINKQNLNQMMAQFEQAFYQFIEHDLLGLMIDGALWDITRIQRTIQEFIHSSSLSDAARMEKIKTLEKENNQANQVIDSKDTSSFETRLLERIERQLHFVDERFGIRFNDMFQAYFNPSRIKDSGKKGRKQVEQSRNQFIDYIGYELLQEVRAVALRMEQQMRMLQSKAYDLTQKEILEINSMFTLPQFELDKIETPDFQQAFESIDMSRFDQAVKKYKNTKSFFENNEVVKMREMFYETIEPLTITYIEDQQKVMLDYYSRQWVALDQHITQKQKAEIKSIVTEFIQILNDTNNKSHLLQLQANIKASIEKIS